MRHFNNTSQIENHCQVDFEMFICRKNELPSNSGSKKFYGKYKGIPWQVVIQDSGDYQKKQIFFYSKVFSDILAKRLVYFPYLRHTCVMNGKLLLPSAVFSYDDKLYILFGLSGTGKTKMMLKALERGAKFVNDERAILMPAGGLNACSEIIALGYATVRETKFWYKLPNKNKLLLWVYHLIYLVSKKYIKFNLYINPKQLDIERHTDADAKRIVFVHLVKASEKRRMSPLEAAFAILEEEDRFRQLYGDIFLLSDLREKTKDISTSIFAACSCWRIPIGTTMDEVLSLE